MDPNCTFTCFFCTKHWSNESEKSWGTWRKRWWCHSKSYTPWYYSDFWLEVLTRINFTQQNIANLIPIIFHTFRFPSTVPSKTHTFGCHVFSESFCFTFAVCFFSVYGFNTFVRMSSMNWRAPAVFLLHVLMWQCLKIKGLYISIYLSQNPPATPSTDNKVSFNLQ